ncbi:DMT family transporter [Sphingomonas profundi]|uniref:DMT family transporter n=1 Tax=Alterirhizorhabdus profundi TaxID=2681549 RepID=UPI0012E8B5B7|nr:DMT family transporter [Sphingomonas profundi]
MNKTLEGWTCGLIGVLIFSGSLPATRLAVTDLDPVFLTLVRAAIAGVIGFVVLALSRQPLPKKADVRSLLIVALGVILGFPLLTALALQRMNAASSIIFTGLLPLSTAIFAVWRARERPARGFWLFAVLGGLCVGSYAWSPSALSHLSGDMLMLAAIILCGLGYAEGAVLSRRLGGWQVICWALVLTLPVALLALGVAARPNWPTVGVPALIGLAYVSLFSMLIGFMFWYRGLALGGIAAVGQLQLVQPLFGLGLAALLLHEQVGWGMVVALLSVIACVAGARHFSVATVRA